MDMSVPDSTHKPCKRAKLPEGVKRRLKKALKSVIVSINDLQSGFSGKKKLISFIFHNMFTSTSEIELNETHPQQRHTVDQFRFFIEYFLHCDYGFISPQDIITNNIVKQRNILITFDDGYFSSLNALPVLEEYQVPAVFFVTTNNIKENRLFWWDVFYRKRRKAGVHEKEIFNEEESLHELRHEDIVSYLSNEFGENAFFETNDLNRPLSPLELKKLSENKLVTIGNHAADHIHFHRCTDDEIKSQIETTQRAICEMTGKTPDVISYPHGDYNHRIADIARQSGLSLGITCEQRYHDLPLDMNGQEPMALGRFGFLGDSRLLYDLDVFRPELSSYYKLRAMKKSWSSKLNKLLQPLSAKK
jgi:peptidoglycan/xylan/chitin deacetylase (PgdA/CDA1 family)